MPEHNQGQMGGTLRLGQRKTIFKTKKSISSKLRRNAMSSIQLHRKSTNGIRNYRKKKLHQCQSIKVFFLY